MDRQEYLEQLELLNAKRRVISVEQQVLDRKYIEENRKHQEGDRVLVRLGGRATDIKDRGKYRRGIVKDAFIMDYGRIKYNFYAASKEWRHGGGYIIGQEDCYDTDEDIIPHTEEVAHLQDFYEE